MSDASVRINTMRNQFNTLRSSIARHQEVVDVHARKLNTLVDQQNRLRLRRISGSDDDLQPITEVCSLTLVDLDREEQLIKEMEYKKYELERRVTRLGEDLRGML